MHKKFYMIEFEIEDAITTVAKTPKRERAHGNSDDPIYQWANELRPSMRKLRQGMDSLCKTARLICRYVPCISKTCLLSSTHSLHRNTYT